MEESPDFERLRADGALAKRPVAHAVTRQRRGLLRAFAISALGSITYYVGITYVPAFLTTAGSLTEADSLLALDGGGRGGDPRHPGRRACCPTGSAASPR